MTTPQEYGDPAASRYYNWTEHEERKQNPKRVVAEPRARTTDEDKRERHALLRTIGDKF